MDIYKTFQPKYLKRGLLLIALLMCHIWAAAQPTGTIRGAVTDAASGGALPYVNVVVMNTAPPAGTTTDADGKFHLDGLPVGRCDLRFTFVGYESAEFREIMVSSGKETVIEVTLRESARQIEDVIVRPKVNKEAPLNPMALAGGRMLSVEEANRYAGGFDDPARLVTAFAGVAGSMNSNSIAIRGNSPQFLQWRLEGVEAVNPTHFSDITGMGGGILTAFSAHTLGNSDFFTGAFPAEYGNALSGVFDMQLRTGNNQQYEHAVQFGTLGVEAASEGPFGKGSRASYLVNYRYSSLALAGDLFPNLLQQASGMRYQDVSFKLNFPTKKAGTFSIYGIGVKDHYIELAPKDTAEWEDLYSSDSDFRQTKIIGGAGHRIGIGGKAYLKSSMSVNYVKNAIYSEDIFIKGNRTPNADMKNTNWNVAFNSYLNTKFGAAHTNRTGIGATALFYDLDYRMPPSGMQGHAEELVNFARSSGNTIALSAYSQSQLRIGSHLTANVGLHAMYFRLNGEVSVEPRAGIRWQAFGQHAFSLAYGKHSRRENTDYYFVKGIDGALANRDLDFAKAHHLVIAYDWSITEHLHLKVEPYFQHLYDVPVEDGTPMSIINYRDFWMMTPLVNHGKGRNYGIDITLERYLHNGWYYMLTASVFSSRYAGGDGVWHNTRLNRNFTANALGGKEWNIRGKNILSVSLRFALMGGERYIPFDEAASIAAQRVVYDNVHAYNGQLDTQLIAHFTAGYKINRDRTAHTISLQMINVGGSGEYGGDTFNYRHNRPEIRMSAISIPNISYKVEF